MTRLESDQAPTTLFGGDGGRRDFRRHSSRLSGPERKKMQAVAAKPIALASAVRRTATSRANSATTRGAKCGDGSAESNTGQRTTSSVSAPAASSVSPKSNHGSQSQRLRPGIDLPSLRGGASAGADPRQQLRTVAGRASQILFDAQELVVLGDAVGAAGRAGLDLAGVRRHGDVGDGGILG